MTRRKLPIGIQTFQEIREDNHYYVDKTGYAQRMVEEGKHYFLSRPRRFGKSLLVDTLKELFEGNEPLFRGLHVHDGWDWSARHPVLRLSFGGGNFTEPGHLHANLMAQLGALERRAGARSGPRQRLRRQVPPPGAPDPPDRGRVQPRVPQPRGVRGGERLSRKPSISRPRVVLYEGESPRASATASASSDLSQWAEHDSLAV